MFFSFGAAFQLPLVVAMLCRTGITSVPTLKKRHFYCAGVYRRYVVIPTGCVVANSAGAVMFVIEAGLLLARWWKPATILSLLSSRVKPQPSGLSSR